MPMAKLEGGELRIIIRFNLNGLRIEIRKVR